MRGVSAGDETAEKQTTERPADPAAPFSALAFKVNATPTGRLTHLRVYSGTIEKGDTVWDATAHRAERVGRILPVQADRHAQLDRAVAGDIVAVVGLKSAKAGTTLCDPHAPLVLEPPSAADPVVSVAVEARRSTDTDRLATALARLAEEDPSLVVRTDPETGQTVLSGMGELHLEVAVEKIRRTHGLEVAVGRPRVAHRETVVRGVTGHVHRHVKQDGGAGQFAHVVLDVEPLHPEPGGTGFEFRSTVVGGRVPQEYVRAVEAGCRDALAEGPLAGHPVTGLRVTLTDGATHVKDSSEMAFRTAGRAALLSALRASAMAVLEPGADVTVTVPEDAVGSVLGDLAARRGRVTDSTVRPGTAVVTATVPLAELFGYATRDDAEKAPERVGNPTWPFAVHPPEYVAPRLRQIDRDSAENLLLALTEAGCTLSNLQYFDEFPDELRAMARTILARYGDEATYHTNVSKTGSAPGTLDFTLESLGYAPMSVLMEDCGLVVVSDTEVGLFWSFSD